MRCRIITKKDSSEDVKKKASPHTTHIGYVNGVPVIELVVDREDGLVKTKLLAQKGGYGLYCRGGKAPITEALRVMRSDPYLENIAAGGIAKTITVTHVDFCSKTAIDKTDSCTRYIGFIDRIPKYEYKIYGDSILAKKYASTEDYEHIGEYCSNYVIKMKEHLAQRRGE